MPRGKAKNQTPKADAATEALIDPVKTEQREKRIERRGKPLLDLIVEYRDPEHLTPYVNNAKEHPTEQIDNIAGSIAEFNFDQPIVVDEQGVIIKGHGRRAAAIRLGMKAVPVIVRSDLTEVQKKAARIADNKVAESSWSKEILSLELKSLTLDNFDMNLTGFNTEELKEYLTFQVEELPPADLTPEPGELPAIPVSIRGDLWQLGGHRLMCGDSTSTTDFEKLMAGDKATLIFADAPYGVNFKQGRYCPSAGTKFREHEILNDDKQGGDLTAFIAEAFRTALSFCESAAVIYAWSAPLLEGAALAQGLLDAGIHIQSKIIWKKNTFVLGRCDYHWQHEECWYGYVGKDHPWYGGRDKGSVWDVNKLSAMEYHPTQKPVELAEIALENSTKPGGRVIDMFAGSGMTLIAAERKQRVSYCMDIDPRYVDVTIKRWQEMTGQDAYLAGEDLTFAEIKERRNV